MTWNIGALKKAPAAPAPRAPVLVAKPLPPRVVEPPMCPCGKARLVSTIEQTRQQCDMCILDARLAEGGDGSTTIVHADGSATAIVVDDGMVAVLACEAEYGRPMPPPTPAPPLLAPVTPAPVQAAPRKRRAVVEDPDDLWDQYLLGDALAGITGLPDKSVDHTITDPPYEEHTHTKAMRLDGEGSSKIDDFGFAHITEEQRLHVAQHIVRVTKGWALVFCEDNAMHLWRAALEKFGAKWRRNCIWHKTNAMPKVLGDGPGQAIETFVAVWCGTGKSVWNRGGRGNVWAYPKEHSEIHKTKKPLALMQDLIVSFTRPKEIVLDVFAGSATTLIASKQLGRRYLGWELDAKCHAAASEDLRNTREQLGMFRTLFAGDPTMRAGAFDEDAENSRAAAAKAQSTMFGALGLPEKTKKPKTKKAA